MKSEKSQVRKILIAMIVDSTVLGRVASKWDEDGLFKDDWANLVGGWCVDFYERYGKAPRKHVEGLFAAWAEDNGDKTKISLLEKFLASLSGEYAKLKHEINTDYMVDASIQHFNQVRVEKHIEELQGCLDRGKVDRAFKAANSFGKLELGLQNITTPLEDRSVVMAAFAEKAKPLIKYRGALGNFMQDLFQRDAFVSFMGPEKCGKTFWLLDTAYRAMLQGCRVAFFEVGDMSRNQIMRRLMSRAADRPWKDKTIDVPLGIETPEDGKVPELQTEQRKFKTAMTADEAWTACCKVIKKSGKELLKLGCWPNDSLSVLGLKSEIQQMIRVDEWVPDVVVVDYADLLATPAGYGNDSQEKIDATWKALRSLSQQLHCCVVTATQASAASYYAGTLDRSHFSRDKRKFAHVTAMIGINQSKEEKRIGVYRLNQLAIRETEYDEEKCVFTAGCLALANPAIRSTF